MKKIADDYVRHMSKMEKKDFVICDPPWNLNDKPPRPSSQLTYSLWGDNVAGMITIFERVNVSLLFVWCINAVIQELFEALNIYNWTQGDKKLLWTNKNKFCWVKQTHKGADFYGVGHWNRNCSEELFIFARPDAKPTRLSERSWFKSVRGNGTKKPLDFETRLFEALKDKGLTKSAYIFSGIDEEKIEAWTEFDIDLVDIKFMEKFSNRLQDERNS